MSTLDLPRVSEHEHAEALPATRPAGEQHAWLTVEHLLYLVIAVLAVLAHFWGLGDRALHHDETLHATYSWNIFTGRGYIHDPLLHGPFLYYFGALNFFLFGDNDFTARLGAAIFGTLLTLSPFLIRRELGRTAALLAAFGLLISPVALYVGRFIRHDIYSMVFEVLIFAAIVRYAGSRQPAWLYLGAAAFGLMVVNQETSYLFALIFGAPLVLLLLWRLWWPGIPLLGVLTLAVIGLIFVLPGSAEVDGGHTALRDPETGLMQYQPGPLFGWYPLETEDNAYALSIRNQPDDEAGRSLFSNFGLYLADLWRFFGHPAVLLAMTLVLATLATGAWFIWRRDAEGRSRWEQARQRGDPVVAVYASLFADRRWLVALLVFAAIYALFFTAFLTNLLGVISGTTGSLLYWLAQHNVERGGQPGYYYFLILFVYEPLLLLWGTVGAIVLGRRWWCWRGLRRAADPEAPAADLLAQAPLLPTALLWWSLGAIGIYSWAGEKMPWLSIHIVVPLTLFSAWALQEVLRNWASAQRELAGSEGETARHWPPAIFGLIFAVILGLSYILMAAYTGFGTDQEVAVPIWMVPLFVLLLAGLLTVAAGLRWGWRWSLGMLAICVTLALSVYTVRNAFRLNYLSGDVPREMMIYTQTSPDVVRAVRALEEASRRRGGQLDMPVIYDNETVWSWYLRDFSSGSRSGPQLSGAPGQEVMAVLMLQENLDRYPQNRDLLSDFRLQRYPLRWWLPENEMYRLLPGWREAPLENTSLLGRALRAPLAQDTVVDLWNYLINRETGVPLGASDFVLAVRPEIADQISPGLGASLEYR